MKRMNLNGKAILILVYFLLISLFDSNAQAIKDDIVSDTSDIFEKQLNDTRLSSSSGLTITFDSFNKGAINDPLQLIQGKVPGFVINSMNSMGPNTDLQVQIRGNSTFYLSTDPFYIIDGIPSVSPTLIQIQDIDSIRVLKKLSETSRYGFRGSNGVVMIYTRQNSAKKINIYYNTFGYFEKFSKESDVMSANEWRQLKNDWATSELPNLREQSGRMIDYNSQTNWRNEISENKLSISHHFGIYGKIKNTGYSTSFEISDYHGTIKKSDNAFRTGQISLSQLALKGKFKFDISIMGTKRNFSDIINNPFSKFIILTTNTFNPTIPTFQADTSRKYIDANPLQRVNATEDERSMNNSLLSVSTCYKILDGLNVSFSFSNHVYKTINLFTSSVPNIINQVHFLKREEEQIENENTYDFNLNYYKSFGIHHFNTFISYTDLRNENTYSIEDLIRDDDYESDISSKCPIEPYQSRSIYANIRYDLKKKYYLSLGLSYETFPNSSWFFENSNDLFPTVSAAWLLKKESFLVNREWLDQLNLRFDYGFAQRLDNMGPLLCETDFGYSKNLRGEIMQEIDLGMDISVLSNRFGLSFDYYKRETNNGLNLVLLPPGPFPDYLSNITRIKNNGLEVCINGTPISRPVKWTFSVNCSYNCNEVLSDTYFSGGYNLKGHRVGDFMGLHFGGFARDGEMIVLNGQGDTTEYSSKNFEVIGNGVPTTFLGITHFITYKNIDLSISARGAFGFNIKNRYKFYDYLESNNRKTVQSMDQRIWADDHIYQTDYIIEKGDYFKIDNVSIGYTFPLQNRLIQKMRFFIACNNLAVITNFSGEDPEMAGINGLSPGYYNDNHYLTRRYVFGLKIGF